MKNKEDTIKQRAFFQKQRMKVKCKNLDPQASPNGNNTGNVDLLTLFIVNQIASKKMYTSTGKSKINMLNTKNTKKTLNEPIELPMSPCSPSNLKLATSQPQYSADTTVDTPGFEVRQHHIAKEFKFKPLSPLLESNLSDVSGPENQPHILNTISPLPDPFNIQSRPASHVSSSLPSQENPDPDSMKFVSFSQQMKPANPWTDVSKESHVLQNSSVAETQFAITLPTTGTAEKSTRSVLFPASPLKSSEQQEEPLFIDFSNRDDKENPHSEKTTNIFLETSLSSSMGIENGDGSQSMDHDGHFLTQEGVDQWLQYACSSGNNSTSAPSQAPSCKQKLQIKEQRHDGNADKNPPKMQDVWTQTAAVSAISCCDVSVQCSLIHTNSNYSTFPTDGYTTSGRTTRRQSVHFNEVSALASATKEQAQTPAKSPKGLSFRKPHRQTSMKKTPTPILKRPLRKGLVLKVGQPLESRVKIGRCDAKPCQGRQACRRICENEEELHSRERCELCLREN